MDYNLYFVDIYQNQMNIINKFNISEYTKKNITYNIGNNYIKNNNILENIPFINKDSYLLITLKRLLFHSDCDIYDDNDNNDNYNIIIKNHNHNHNNLLYYDYVGLHNIRYIHPIFFKNNTIILSSNLSEILNFNFGLNIYKYNTDFDIYYKKIKNNINLFTTHSILCGDIYASHKINYNYGILYKYINYNGELYNLFVNNKYNMYIDIHSFVILFFMINKKININKKIIYNNFDITIWSNDMTDNLYININKNVIRSMDLYGIIIHLIKYIKDKFDLLSSQIMVFLLYNLFEINKLLYYLDYKNIINNKFDIYISN